MSPSQAAAGRRPNRYDASRALHERACRVLAGGVSSEFRKVQHPHPLFFERAAGTRIVDVDGNEYLDFALSQGPLIVGHSHPAVLAAVASATERGQLYAGQSLGELELAETLQRRIPCAERLRFSLSGSEADHVALRIARAATGRPRFIRFEGHYHGWFDNVASGIGGASVEALGPREAPTARPWTAGLPPGAADECIVLPWNDLALVERTLARRSGEIAAIVTEPVMCNTSCVTPDPGFLAGLRDLCDRHGVVLIFDEVITGFRLAPGGAQERFGVVPDLAVFGKALASGWPISVIAGRERFMRLLADGVVIHAGTMNAGVPSIAAAAATLAQLDRPGMYERLHALGGRLAEGLRRAARDAGAPLLVQGAGPMLHTGFTPLARVRDLRDALSYDRPRGAAFVAGLQERGVRVIARGLWYLSTAHTEAEVDHAIAVASDTLRAMEGGRPSPRAHDAP
ncbi:MAG TPA: aspartate aminotransferase family protein [Planctomycetota bacterium]|nr:aspartate aminotransferase family protein [Planctomycetota bacterium]